MVCMPVSFVGVTDAGRSAADAEHGGERVASFGWAADLQPHAFGVAVIMYAPRGVGQ
jgi:hypothetical protein